MKFILSKASSYSDRKEIDITTIGELLNLIDKYGCDLILSKEYYNKNDVITLDNYGARYGIMIYDDYIE